MYDNLYDFQKRVVSEIQSAFRAGKKRIMLYAPCSAGKTEMAISFLDAALKNDKKSIMILDRIILCNQTSTRLDKYNIDHGIIQAGTWRWRPKENIQIASAQTLEKMESFPGVSLVIIDEAHCLRKAVVDIVKSNDMSVIGLSASPFTKGISDVYDHVISATTMHELMEQKYICPLKVFVCKEIDMTGARKVAGEWSQKETTERGVKITGDIVTSWIDKTNELFGKPKKTIVFCSGVAHGESLAAEFAEHGYNFINISYKDKQDYKDQVIEEFGRADTEIHGLIATDILTKGFSVDDVEIIVAARPFTKSFQSWVQQIGRGMRKSEGKKFCALFDHSGNYVRFKDDWEDLYFNGVTELNNEGEKAKKEPTEEQKEAAKCPKCSAAWPAQSDICSNCGFVRERRNDVSSVPGELVEIGALVKKEKYSMEYKQQFYSELLGYANIKGFKPGWAYWKYKEKIGVNPASSLSTTLAHPGPSVLNFIKHLAIKHSKRKL